MFLAAGKFFGEEPVNMASDTPTRRLPVCSNEVFLSTPLQIYVVGDTLSSIYITSSTISTKQKYIFSRKEAVRAAQVLLPGSLIGDA